MDSSNEPRPLLLHIRNVPISPPVAWDGRRGVFSRLVLDRSDAMGNEAPVLIAGGGLTGLAMASFLAQQGIRSITIERLKESSPLPRAAFFHMRTLEMFRELGIETRVRQESAKEFVPGRRADRHGLRLGAQAGGHHFQSQRGRRRGEPVSPLVPEPAQPRAHPARARRATRARRSCRAPKSRGCARTRPA